MTKTHGQDERKSGTFAAMPRKKEGKEKKLNHKITPLPDTHRSVYEEATLLKAEGEGDKERRVTINKMMGEEIFHIETKKKEKGGTKPNVFLFLVL